MQTIDLMTGYNIEIRIKINRRWEELENQAKFNIPQLPPITAKSGNRNLLSKNVVFGQDRFCPTKRIPCSDLLIGSV